jgi:hypothetical protein
MLTDPNYTFRTNQEKHEQKKMPTNYHNKLNFPLVPPTWCRDIFQIIES